MKPTDTLHGVCPTCGTVTTFTPRGIQEDGLGGSFPVANCNACHSTITSTRILILSTAADALADLAHEITPEAAT